MDTHCVGYKVKKDLYSHILYIIKILTMAIWLIYNITIKDLENSNYNSLSWNSKMTME